MLAVRGVTGGYGQTTVLWDVTFDVARGQAVALLGRNGMGKTTTLLAIMGLNPPRGGSVRFKERELSGMAAFEIARLGIGYAPEGRQLFAPLTVVQNLRIPFVNKHPDRRAWTRELDRVFTLFPRLGERRTQAAGSLSGGEQQMLAIGRALIGGDDFLILDEPTEGLAPTVVETIVAAMRVLKAEGHTVLLVEQNMHTALAVADHVYVLEKGRISASGPADELGRDRARLESLLGATA